MSTNNPSRPDLTGIKDELDALHNSTISRTLAWAIQKGLIEKIPPLLDYIEKLEGQVGEARSVVKELYAAWDDAAAAPEFRSKKLHSMEDRARAWLEKVK
jgi:hypothetical protein